MKPIMIILDDWGRRRAASTVWEKIKEQVDLKFLNGKDPMDPAIFENVEIIMAMRERTRIDGQRGAHAAYWLDGGRSI